MVIPNSEPMGSDISRPTRPWRLEPGVHFSGCGQQRRAHRATAVQKPLCRRVLMKRTTRSGIAAPRTMAAMAQAQVGRLVKICSPRKMTSNRRMAMATNRPSVIRKPDWISSLDSQPMTSRFLSSIPRCALSLTNACSPANPSSCAFRRRFTLRLRPIGAANGQIKRLDKEYHRDRNADVKSNSCERDGIHFTAACLGRNRLPARSNPVRRVRQGTWGERLSPGSSRGSFRLPMSKRGQSGKSPASG